MKKLGNITFYRFGAKFASNSTGIILNNEMDDFFFPHITNLYGISLTSPANLMQPGKRPLSSMCPTIIIDENKDVVLVVGAAGGSKITTSVAQVYYYYIIICYQDFAFVSRKC